MTTGHVFIATSLDGFIARRDGDIDFLDSVDAENEDNGYYEFMDTVDGLIMGRGTYEKVLTLVEDWPYEKPVIVLSHSLLEADLREDLAGKVSVSAEAPKEIMRRLEGEGWKRAYIDGGQVIQSFLRDGLIADLRIFRIPVLLGDGLPLFGALDSDIALDHVDTKTYPSGIVESRYRVAEPAA